MTQKPVTLKELQNFTNIKAKTFTNLPVKLKLDNLPITETYRVNTHIDTYGDIDVKTHKPVRVTDYGIRIDKQYFKENKYNLYELTQAILHELAHIKIRYQNGKDMSLNQNKEHHYLHGTEFKKIAQGLGTDHLHQKQYWDNEHYHRK
jgi:hypothetical protein